MDFKEVESAGVDIGDMEEGDVLDGKSMEGTSVLKESEEGLAIFFGQVIREKAVSGSI